MKDYVVTDAAPLRLCGKRVKPGDTLTLAEPVARYEIALGFLAEPVAEPAEAVEVEAPADPAPSPFVGSTAGPDALDAAE